MSNILFQFYSVCFLKGGFTVRFIVFDQSVVLTSEYFLFFCTASGRELRRNRTWVLFVALLLCHHHSYPTILQVQCILLFFSTHYEHCLQFYRSAHCWVILGDHTHLFSSCTNTSAHRLIVVIIIFTQPLN